mgnify:CR=1 FL=1
MPYDLPPRYSGPLARRPATGLRAAVLELMSRSGAGAAALDERELRAALRALVAATHDPAAALAERYHGSRHDPRARVFAAHAD